MSLQWKVVEYLQAERITVTFTGAPVEREYTIGHFGKQYRPLSLRLEDGRRLFVYGDALQKVEGVGRIPVVSYFQLWRDRDVDALPGWVRDIVLWLWNPELLNL